MEKKRQLNPEVKKGDRIELWYMQGEFEVPQGELGTVTDVVQIQSGQKPINIIYVNWDNGSVLSISTDVDKWKLAPTENLDESMGQIEFFNQNEDLFDSFDLFFLRKYLKLIQKTGIVNMFGSAPLLYCGSEHLERYYGEGKEDDENFQKCLEMANSAKDKMIQGTMKWLRDNDKEVTVESVNMYIKRFATKMVQLYSLFY